MSDFFSDTKCSLRSMSKKCIEASDLLKSALNVIINRCCYQAQ